MLFSLWESSFQFLLREYFHILARTAGFCLLLFSAFHLAVNTFYAAIMFFWDTIDGAAERSFHKYLFVIPYLNFTTMVLLLGLATGIMKNNNHKQTFSLIDALLLQNSSGSV